MIAAAPRDASWYRHPDTSSFKVVHASTDDHMAACDAHVFLSDHPRWANAAEVPIGIRCRRRACVLVYAQAEGLTPSQSLIS